MGKRPAMIVTALVGLFVQIVSGLFVIKQWMQVEGVAPILLGVGALFMAAAGWQMAGLKGRPPVLGAVLGLASLPGLLVLSFIPPLADARAVDGAVPADGALLKAAAAGDLDGIRARLDDGAAVDGRDKAGKTALHHALDGGHVDAARALVEAGARVDAPDKLGNTPLHLAAELGSRSAAAWLIEQGADVDARGNDGWTPLHLAASWGAKEVVRLLVEHGADLTAVNDKGFTPQGQAEFDKHEDVAALLEQAAGQRSGQ